MNAQEIFYILGSVAFGLVVLFVLTLIVVLILIKQQATKLSNRLHAMSGEIQDLVETGKRYTETLGNGMMTSLALRIIKSFLRKRR